MPVSVDQLEKNLSYYIQLSSKENILISENGKEVAVLSGIDKDKLDTINYLQGILPDNGDTIEKAREDRLSKI